MHAITRWGLLSLWDACRPRLPWPTRLLVIGPKGLGDAVAALPALRLLQRHAPHTHITWLSNPSHAPLVAMAGVDAFLPDAPPATPHDPTAFDALLSFNDVPAQGPAGMDLARIPLRIGTASGALLPHWCNHLVHTKRLGEPRHEILRNMRLLIPFGVRPRLGLAALEPLGRLQPAAVPLPADLPRAGYVVLHPFSAGSAREWPVAHWRSLAGTLAAAGRRVVFTGSAAEGLRLAAEWPLQERPPEVFDACGRLDLAQLGSLLQRADSVVAASTGPLHLGAALGAPTLGLFVPRKGLAIDRWAPLGQRAAGIQAHRRCPTPQRCDAPSCLCMAALAPDTVARLMAPAPGQPLALQALPTDVLCSHPGAPP